MGRYYYGHLSPIRGEDTREEGMEGEKLRRAKASIFCSQRYEFWKSVDIP